VLAVFSLGCAISASWNSLRRVRIS
jgi:hypothetical protein